MKRSLCSNDKGLPLIPKLMENLTFNFAQCVHTHTHADIKVQMNRGD